MKVIAIDLIDTLVQRADKGIISAISSYQELSALGLEGKEFFAMFRKRYLEYSMGNYVNDEEFLKVLGQDCAAQDTDAFAKRMMEVIYSTTPPLSDSEAFLAKAREKWDRVIIASNYVYGWAERIVKHNGWEVYIDEMVISSAIGCRKPARRFFNILLDAAGAKASDVCLVGDSIVNDMYGANQVGIVGILLDRANKACTYSGKRVRSLLEVIDAT